MAAEFRLLGGVGVDIDGRPADIGHARQQCVLVALLVDVNQTVSVDQLVDRVWGEHPPLRAVGTLHSYVTRLRRALAEAKDVAIVRRSGGYAISVEDVLAVDVRLFGHLLAQARATQDPDRATALFAQALGLWRGEALTGLDSSWAATVREGLARQRAAAELDHTDLRLRLGRHAELVAELFTRAGEHPLDERVAGQLMLTLYRTGRQAEALAHYQRIRALLAEELGADPGAELHQLHQQILTADPLIATPAASAPQAPPSAVPRQLPAPPVWFTGRDKELTALTAALTGDEGPGGTVAISAIGGSGGIGKTGLALHWAHQHVDEFPDGQLHVNLRGFDPTEPPTQPAVAIRGFLDALGVAGNAMPADPDARAAMYRSVVAGKRMLIVLDNAADSSHVVPLLPGSPTCTVLVTSRDRLVGLVAAHGARPLPLDVLSEDEARTLLATRLGADRLAAEPDAVAELLACCGGFPLALSILAGRATVHPEFPLAELAAELRDATTRLGALDEGDPAASLPAVLSWSYAALKPDQAAVFGLLGLAPGPDISVPAASSLTDLPVGRARQTLRALERVSLLQQDVPGRYRMHDLVRLYAVEQAGRDQSEPTREAALRRLIDFYVHTAHAGDGILNPYASPVDIDRPAPGCHPQPLEDGAAALAWFDAEHQNLLAAQQSAAERGWHQSVWHVAWALTGFHWLRGHLHDDVVVCRAGLAAAGHLDNLSVLAMAHGRLGLACARASRHAEAVEQLERALALAEQAGDLPNQAYIHWALAQALALQGEARRALDHATHALKLFQAFDNPAWQARALNVMGWNEAHLGDYDQARAHCEAALALLYAGHPDREGEAGTLDSLGYIAHHSGRHADALDYYDQALTRWLDLGYTYYEANTLDQLGQTHVALGDHDQARAVWQRALRLCQAQHRTADAARIQERLDALSDGGALG